MKKAPVPQEVVLSLVTVPDPEAGIVRASILYPDGKRREISTLNLFLAKGDTRLYDAWHAVLSEWIATQLRETGMVVAVVEDKPKREAGH